MPSRSQTRDVVFIGILALQGAFAEHQASLQQLSLDRNIIVVLVRTVNDLDRCHALIIPGGESTTIALLARLAGLLEPLREFRKVKPVWGTCAGAILLAQSVEDGAKKGGQELLGGVSITVARNGWGSQGESFEAPIYVDGLGEPNRPFTGIFIRAPVILSLVPTAHDPAIEVIARLPPVHLPHLQTLVSPDGDDTDPLDTKAIVALRQGLHFVTTFHPELTRDNRFHDYFLREFVFPVVA
jgi:5'-phosphate synthase pdxT subunit